MNDPIWLQKKYINLISSQLRNFKWVSNENANFSCPICKDSETDLRKARGYLLMKANNHGYGFSFYCHNNSSCARSFNKFLEFVSPTYYKEYIVELFKENRSKSKSKPVVTTKPVTPTKLPPTDGIFAEVVKSCALLPMDHPANVYLLNRLIPSNKFFKFVWTPKFGTVARMMAPENKSYRNIPDEERLLLVIKNKENKVLGVIGRTIDPDSKSPRYITLKISEDVEKIYGLDSYDPTLEGYVVEGPIDSLFLPNAIALAGSKVNSDRLKEVINPEKTAIVLDNEPRNEDVVNGLMSFVDKGFKVVVWNGMTTDYKDINEMILSKKYTIGSLLEFMRKNTYNSIRAKFQINNWKRI